MTRPNWFIELLKKSFPLRFLLAKLTRLPGFKFIINKLFFENDLIFYIPNDNILKRAKTIEVNREINPTIDVLVPSKIMTQFIDNTKYIFQMNFCLCRTANECKTYSSQEGCLFLGESVLKIDPSYGKLVTKQEAKDYIKRCQEQGLVQLIGKNKIDAVWLDAFPENKLLTICNCCECCCLWKMLPDLSLKISRNVTRMPGVNVTINQSECKRCYNCLESCFVEAITISKEGVTKINQTICRGCGRCVIRCPQDAIEFKVNDSKFIDNIVNRISTITDVI